MSKATKRKIVRQEVCDPESWEPPGPGRALARVLAGRGNNLHEVMIAGEIPPTRTRSSSPQVVGKEEVNPSVSLSSSEPKAGDAVSQGDGDTAPADCLSKTSSEAVASSGSDGKVQASAKTEDWSEKRILASMPRKFRRSVWVRRGDVVVIEWIPEGDKVKAEIVSVVLRKMVRALRASGELEWPPEFDHPDFGDVGKSHYESDSSDENEDDLPQNTNRRPVPVVDCSSSSTSSTTSTTSTSSDDEESDSDDDDGGGEAAGSIFENPNRRTVSRSLSKSNSSISDGDEGKRGKGDVILNLKKGDSLS